jgi:hypothetical protein
VKDKVSSISPCDTPSDFQAAWCSNPAFHNYNISVHLSTSSLQWHEDQDTDTKWPRTHDQTFPTCLERPRTASDGKRNPLRSNLKMLHITATRTELRHVLLFTVEFPENTTRLATSIAKNTADMIDQTSNQTPNLKR